MRSFWNWTILATFIAGGAGCARNDHGNPPPAAVVQKQKQTQTESQCPQLAPGSYQSIYNNEHLKAKITKEGEVLTVWLQRPGSPPSTPLNDYKVVGTPQTRADGSHYKAVCENGEILVSDTGEGDFRVGGGTDGFVTTNQEGICGEITYAIETSDELPVSLPVKREPAVKPAPPPRATKDNIWSRTVDVIDAWLDVYSRR